MDQDAMQFELLKQRYIQSVPDKLQQLERDWVSAQRSGWREPGLLPLLTGVHRLAGSAGSYGFPELTLAARELEERLVQLRMSPDKPETLRAAGEGYRLLLELLQALIFIR